MRISTGYQYQILQTDIDTTTTNYVNAQQVVATGRRINQVSDDPYGSMAAIGMSALQSQLNQFSANLGTAKDFLTNNEAALTQATTLLNKAYQLAVQGANSSNDHAALQAMSNQIGDLMNNLVTIANTQNSSGQYIFAGQNSGSQPFTVKGGALTYSGDGNNVSVEVAPNQQMIVNVPGNPLITNIYNQLQQLKTDLANGSFSKISNTDIANMKSSIANVSQLNGQFGASISQINDMTQANTRRSTQFTSNISNVVDADIAQAMVQLTQAQTAYQAALDTTAQATKYSLLDFIH